MVKRGNWKPVGSSATTAGIFAILPILNILKHNMGFLDVNQLVLLPKIKWRRFG